MSLQGEAADAALGVLRSLGKEVRGLIRDEIDWRRQHPCATAKYFEIMAARGNAFWRPWRTYQARKFRAKCIASGEAHICGMDKP